MGNRISKQLLLLASAMLVALGVHATSGSDPEPTPPSSGSYERGPNPTTASLEANRGPYSVRTISVSSLVRGFGGGTIHYPTGTTGTMGVIAVIPGYVSYESSIRWWGPRLASHGFVVITINTSSIYDQPNSRANQLVAALNYVIDESNSRGSAINGMVDPNRRAVIGWSMGGGGALKATADDRSIMASIPQAPYYSGSNSFNRITTPTLVIACESDSIASVRSHASPLYERIPSSTPKAFLQIRRGNHYCANSGNDNEDILGKYGVAWMKRFVDLDRRYDQFLCGVNHTAPLAINEYRSTCPYR